MNTTIFLENADSPESARLLSELEQVCQGFGEILAKGAGAFELILSDEPSEEDRALADKLLHELGRRGKWGSVVETVRHGKTEVFGVGPSAEAIELALEQYKARKIAEEDFWESLAADIVVPNAEDMEREMSFQNARNALAELQRLTKSERDELLALIQSIPAISNE